MLFADAGMSADELLLGLSGIKVRKLLIMKG
jgi:hypothetical protein